MAAAYDVLIIASGNKLYEYYKSFATKAEAWHYILTVYQHAQNNGSIKTCDAIVYDMNQRTGRVFDQFKEIYRQALKR